MLIVTSVSDLSLIAHPGIRTLLSLRVTQLNTPDELDVPDASLTTFIVVEGGEATSEIEQAAGFPILTSLFDDLPFDHPDFYPSFEIMEEHSYEQYRFYEMLLICNDDGAATAIFVADQEGVDPDLLAMCRSWATPAVSTP